MSKLKNSWIIIVMVFFLTILTPNSTYMNLIVVQGIVEPTIESEIIIGIDLYHQSDINISEITHLTSILNTTFSSQQVVFLEEKFTSENLADIDVLTILAPTLGFDPETEIPVVEEFIKKGNSVLVASGYRNQTREPSNDFLNSFGLSFNYSSSIISEKSLARNFTTPITPLSENISQLICPNGLGISFNKSKLESYQSPAIVYYNPVLVDNSAEAPSGNNTLISTLEFENGARILAIGSADMFNDSYIEPLANTTSIFLDNTDFLLNAIRWLGRNTGIMNFYDPWVDLDGKSIDIGEIVYGNVTLVNSQNQTLSQVQLIITLERTGTILSSRIMYMFPNNASNYSGWVSTKGLSHGYCDVVFIANRIGYLPVELRAGRIYLKPPFPTPKSPNSALQGLFLASTLLFLTNAILVYTNLGKKK
ncbi:MAG: hypothetical protein JSU57_02235 [Candidatus Heimdallarchaeota archaeon]|nr:MAG: hypothetical protein JSU57_02235 [Candidatus Heimdallarchaeota archaeon]